MAFQTPEGFKILLARRAGLYSRFTTVQFSWSSVIDSAVCSAFISVKESLRMPNRVSSPLVAALVFIFCSAWLASLAAAQRPITVDDYFHIHEVHDPQLSPERVRDNFATVLDTREFLLNRIAGDHVAMMLAARGLTTPDSLASYSE